MDWQGTSRHGPSFTLPSLPCTGMALASEDGVEGTRDPT